MDAVAINKDSREEKAHDKRESQVPSAKNGYQNNLSLAVWGAMLWAAGVDKPLQHQAATPKIGNLISTMGRQDIKELVVKPTVISFGLDTMRRIYSILIFFYTIVMSFIGLVKKNLFSTKDHDIRSSDSADCEPRTRSNKLGRDPRTCMSSSTVRKHHLYRYTHGTGTAARSHLRVKNGTTMKNCLNKNKNAKSNARFEVRSIALIVTISVGLWSIISSPSLKHHFNIRFDVGFIIIMTIIYVYHFLSSERADDESENRQHVRVEEAPTAQENAPQVLKVLQADIKNGTRIITDATVGDSCGASGVIGAGISYSDKESEVGSIVTIVTLSIGILWSLISSPYLKHHINIRFDVGSIIIIIAIIYVYHFLLSERTDEEGKSRQHVLVEEAPKVQEQATRVLNALQGDKKNGSKIITDAMVGDSDSCGASGVIGAGIIFSIKESAVEYISHVVDHFKQKRTAAIERDGGDRHELAVDDGTESTLPSPELTAYAGLTDSGLAIGVGNKDTFPLIGLASSPSAKDWEVSPNGPSCSVYGLGESVIHSLQSRVMELSNALGRSFCNEHTFRQSGENKIAKTYRDTGYAIIERMERLCSHPNSDTANHASQNVGTHAATAPDVEAKRSTATAPFWEASPWLLPQALVVGGTREGTFKASEWPVGSKSFREKVAAWH